MKKQQGFTLIELVMVIVILGILAATALPKFVNLQGNARMSSLQSAQGAIKSASSIAHAASLVANSGSITIEGATYTLTNFYPTSTNIATLANLSSDDYTLDTTTTTGTLSVELGTCSFTYTDSAAANTPPVISAITGDTDDQC